MKYNCFKIKILFHDKEIQDKYIIKKIKTWHRRGKYICNAIITNKKTIINIFLI